MARVKKPHTALGIPTRCAFHMVNCFRLGPVLCSYNTASALWHGKNALSPRGSERAIEGLPGTPLEQRGFDRDTGGVGGGQTAQVKACELTLGLGLPGQTMMTGWTNGERL